MRRLPAVKLDGAGQAAVILTLALEVAKDALLLAPFALAIIILAALLIGGGD